MTVDRAAQALALGAASQPDRPANIKEAAEAFEALFVGQMLKMVRESGQGGGLGEADGASSSIMEMAEENLAKQMTKNGGLGLAKLISSQLIRSDQKLTESEAEGTPASEPHKSGAAPR